MYPAVWEPLLERRVDHPAWRSLCSVLCMVWSSRVLLTKGVSLTNKRKNHSKTDLPWRRAACVFLLKALTSPVIGRFNSACLTGKKKKVEELKLLNCIQLFVTLWIVSCQAPLSMGFLRQDYWSGLPCPSPGDLPDLGWTQVPCIAGRFFTIWASHQGYFHKFLNEE